VADTSELELLELKIALEEMAEPVSTITRGGSGYLPISTVTQSGSGFEPELYFGSMPTSRTRVEQTKIDVQVKLVEHTLRDQVKVILDRGDLQYTKEIVLHTIHTIMHRFERDRIVTFFNIDHRTDSYGHPRYTEIHVTYTLYIDGSSRRLQIGW